ncbi:MAG: aminoglycoside phosphotransferase family protein [Clostridia bacterium]|nr:aminoglycoside phosphotransferase family protein [Clostridia bacterium]
MDTKKIVSAFAFSSRVTSIDECKIGHINSTFFVNCEDGRYVVQKINKGIFKNPAEIMANVTGVTDHIRAKLAAVGGDTKNGTLQFVKSGDRYYHIDEEGEYWRAYRFVDGNCYQTCDTTELFCRVGAAFGEFQNQLADYDAATLFEVIPNFHHTAKRYEAFETAAMADVCRRAKDCAEEIAFIRARKTACAFIVDGLATGKFPLRVTHNDTKLNNVIMNKETGEGLCVIDLDTVMPGSLLYDFGDAIRFGASSAAEDETDLDRVYVKTEMFEAFTKGFVTSLKKSITKEELLALPEAARVITLEQAIRFLTDHLQGDTYFRIHHEGHNLERARNQLKLVADLEAKMPTLQAIVNQYL